MLWTRPLCWMGRLSGDHGPAIRGQGTGSSCLVAQPAPARQQHLGGGLTGKRFRYRTPGSLSPNETPNDSELWRARPPGETTPPESRPMDLTIVRKLLLLAQIPQPLDVLNMLVSVSDVQESVSKVRTLMIPVCFRPNWRIARKLELSGRPTSEERAH